MKTNRFLLLAAGISLALAFTFSCSSDDDEDNSLEDNSQQPTKLYYDPSNENQRCRKGIVEYKCFSGMMGKETGWYNPVTHYCNSVSGNIVANKIEECSGDYYELGYQRCKNGVIEELCPHNIFGDIGGQYLVDEDSSGWYNPKTHVCKSCGSRGFFWPINDDGFFTFGNQIECPFIDIIEDMRYIILKGEQCGNSIYEPYDFFDYYPSTRCKDGIVEIPCGDDWYNPETQICNIDNDNNRTVKTLERCGS